MLITLTEGTSGSLRMSSHAALSSIIMQLHIKIAHLIVGVHEVDNVLDSKDLKAKAEEYFRFKVIQISLVFHLTDSILNLFILNLKVITGLPSLVIRLSMDYVALLNKNTRTWMQAILYSYPFHITEILVDLINHAAGHTLITIPAYRGIAKEYKVELCLYHQHNPPILLYY